MLLPNDLLIGFEVEVKENLDRGDFISSLIQFSKDKDHGDIMVLVVMSHGVPGGDRGKIISSDGQSVDIVEDIQKFQTFSMTPEFIKHLICRNFNNFSESLVGKHKLLFIQACRGEERSRTVSYMEEEEQEDASAFYAVAGAPPGAAPGLVEHLENTVT